VSGRRACIGFIMLSAVCFGLPVKNGALSAGCRCRFHQFFNIAVLGYSKLPVWSEDVCLVTVIALVSMCVDVFILYLRL
jgi:hypothetical protein